jgi:hypothetical protein
MVKPEERTEEQVLTVLEHWLEYGDLSIVPKNCTAQQRNRHTQQRERGERENPWVVTLMLSSEVMNSGKVLGKAVGQEVPSFQRRDAPLEISSRTCTSRCECDTLTSATEIRAAEDRAAGKRRKGRAQGNWRLR